MGSELERPYVGEIAVLATMHGKERVIAPLLERDLGLRVQGTSGLDTDQFGTFSREIERKGSQLDAARAKIVAAFAQAPHARFAAASEGIFGPHPQQPFLPLAREIVVLADRTQSLEFIGYDASSETNFAHAIVATPSEAMSFAERLGFPGHGVIVMGCEDDRPAPGIGLAKNLVYGAELERAVRAAIELCGAAFVEADMRAHRNPTRMRAIERATGDLVNRLHRRCPTCGRPDFSMTERIPGLPCADCGAPTNARQQELRICQGCGHRVESPATERLTADPGECE